MTRFFPTEIVQHLTRGSFERLIANLEEAVQEAALFEGASTYVLGTFSGYALVASDEGECARVKYEEAAGAIKILSHENVELPSYGTDEVSDFLVEESSKVLDLWNKGNLTEATRRLRSIVAASAEWSPKDEAGALKAWEESLSQNRPWLKLLAEKRDEIEGALPQWEDLHLRPKFRKLYDGSIPTTDLEEFRGLVLQDLGVIQEKTNALHTQIHNVTNEVKDLASRFEEGSVVTALAAFAEDLLEDLARIDTISKESPKHISRVEHLGRLHDMMAIRLSKAGVANHFVKTMAQRLSDTPSGGKSNA